MNLGIVIAGGGSDIFASETLSTAPNLKMVGYVTDHDLAYLMDCALCLLFPSWTEGFGLPIVEAMARSCAVVSSDRASMPEVCGNAALMASPDDPAAWVNQVRRLNNSAALREDLTERGRERLPLFSWVNSAAGYLDLMREPKRSITSPHGTEHSLPKIAVVIATLGRPHVVTATLKHLLATQSLTPDTIVISCISPEDAGEAADFPAVTIITGKPGLPAQRNAALAELPPETDVVVFFDDDFVADADWLAVAAKTFRDQPDVAAFTGHVLADDIKGAGLNIEDAIHLLETSDRSTSWSHLEPVSSLWLQYGVSPVGGPRLEIR